MTEILNLSGLIGKRVALHNGEDWMAYDYICVGYSLVTDTNSSYGKSEVILIYLLKLDGNGLPITRRMQDIKFES